MFSGRDEAIRMEKKHWISVGNEVFFFIDENLCILFRVNMVYNYQKCEILLYKKIKCNFDVTMYENIFSINLCTYSMAFCYC